MSGTGEAQPPVTFYLDSMTFIFSIEGEQTVSEPARALLDALRRHPGRGVTSELTLAEVLVGSERGLEPQLTRAYLDLIVWSGFLALVPVDRNVLYESAKLRAVHRRTHDHKLSLPDAIHLVSAIQSGCRYFMTHDGGIRPPVNVRKITFTPAEIDEVLKELA